MKGNIWIILLLLLVSQGASAKIILPRVLGNNMVLQQGKPVAIWGRATAGEQITVQFGRQVKSATANDTGAWKLTLDAMRASFTPLKLTIKGTEETITLNNILVGEVWICSGQSNMEYTMRKLEKLAPAKNSRLGDSSAALAKAHNPNIRIFLVNRKTLPVPDSLHRGWDTATGLALRSFSAAGYFFAEELYAKLKVPIGMIASSVPGSSIEPWMQEEAMSSLNYFKGKKIGQDPGKFFYTMINPLAPLSLRGFLWYQGENNCFLRDSIQYAWKMKALISCWRKAWGDNELPFYYTQITPFLYSDSKGKVALDKNTEPQIWEAQQLALTIPHTGMISTNDLTDSVGDLHPTYKWQIGRRLAIMALANTYGKDMVYTGPMYKERRVEGNKMIIRFSNTGGGLVSIDGKPLSWFTIAGKDGIFEPATAVIVDGDKVEVSARGISSPVAVRFSWDDGAQHNLFNKEGFPAMSFRTDNPYRGLFLK